MRWSYQQHPVWLVERSQLSVDVCTEESHFDCPSLCCVLFKCFFLLCKAEETFATPFTICANNCHTMNEPMFQCLSKWRATKH